jgi:F5/8 type C domain
VPTTRFRTIAIVVATLVSGIAIRVYLARALDGKSWNDAAIVALMAIHELKGKFYAFYWGQSYMGSTESLGIAASFGLLGVSDFALYLGLLPWVALFAFAMYGVTRLCGGPQAAAVALLLLAFAPPYLQYHELMPIGGYPETTAFGTLLVWLALRLVYEPLTARARAWHVAAVGLVAGLAFWTNWLILPYFIVAALYLLPEWRGLSRPAMIWSVPLFFVGSLPFWIYNVTHRFTTFELLGRQARLHDDAGLIRWRDIGWVVTAGLERVLGLDADFLSAPLGHVVYAAVTICACAALFSLRRSWRALARGAIREMNPAAALFLLAFATTLVYAEMRPTTLELDRFLMPLTSSTLPLLALGIAWVVRRRRTLGAMLLGTVICLYAAEIHAMHDHYLAPARRPWAGDVDELSRYLERSPIRFAYAEYGDAAITTYLTRDRVVVADYREWRYPLDEVDFRDPAFIVTGKGLSPTLNALNMTYSVARVAGYHVYWPIHYDGVPRAPLPRDSWKLTASAAADDAELLLDGDVTTHWAVATSNDHPSLTLDLGAQQTVTGVYFGFGTQPYEPFEKVRIESSNDGERWNLVKDAHWDFPIGLRSDGQPTMRHNDLQLVLFPPCPARWLRITLLDTFPGKEWSFAELGVFGLGAGQAAFRLPETLDPNTPLLVEKRLRRALARAPDSDAPLLGLRELYRSTGDKARLEEVDELEAARFTPQRHTDWDFGDEIELVGYDWASIGARRYEITYYWQARRHVAADYAAFVHVEGPGYRFQDDQVLGGGSHLTHTWEPGETVKETREIDVPADAPRGSYRLRLGVWSPRDHRHLPLGRWWRRFQSRTLVDFAG